MDGRSPSSSDHFGLLSPFPSSSIAMSPQYGHSCALTILKGDADHPITAHEPIHKKHESSRGPLSPSQPSRFAASFSNLRSASHAASSGFDSSVHVHAVSDHGILLPFLERPAEVKELLFETKANETLMHRLCSVFGGDADHPLLRGKDERWDEMLELLIELDRPLLDDEDWLARLESLVMERSPSFLQDTHEPSTASAPAAPTGALGLHASPDPLESASASVAGDKIRRASRPRNHILSVDRMSAASDAGSDSPPIPGLLPDGRTRHPSGSCGSRDLSESIAAFRANMGLSISPSPSVPGSPKADDAKSDADKSTDSTTRKRKGTSPTDLPAPTSRTADTVEPKISRRSSPDQAQFSKPKHMEDVEARVQTTAGSGLALGGGFSLAKSGANFRRQSHDAATIPQGAGLPIPRRHTHA
uniref:Uncharacterized protein n=1 Tax=Kalmanozyma brasiliensis (strain GHG001) TaxID=1365824 RepID=V5EX26_KALBG